MVLDRLRVPIVQAPMGGGASTVALAAAVGRGGGLGFLAAGYRTAAEVERQIAELRRYSGQLFGVNLFVPPARPADRAAVHHYLAELRPTAASYGVAVGEPCFDDDDWQAKVDLLVQAAPPVVSFVFGCPPDAVVERLHQAGSEVWVTATCPAEADLAAKAGADVLVAQGVEAGAHRASFDDQGAGDPLGLLALLQLLRAQCALPVVAAGGIATGQGVAAVLAAGAVAAQLGTAFLRCPEAGTASAHRRALTSGTPTVLTRAFTGRQARSIINEFVERHHDRAPSAYPEIHHATAPLRAAARHAEDASHLHLWAGQTHELARDLPAEDLVRQLISGARAALELAGDSFDMATGGPPPVVAGANKSQEPHLEGALPPSLARAFAEPWLEAWTGNRPEHLAGFYTDDAFYRDPAVPDGVRGRDSLLAYFRRLLARFPDWRWHQREATPMQGGFLNHWHASIPVPGGNTVDCSGVCTVQLRDGRICRNEVFFDRAALLAALDSTD